MVIRRSYVRCIAGGPIRRYLVSVRLWQSRLEADCDGFPGVVVAWCVPFGARNICFNANEESDCGRRGLLRRVAAVVDCELVFVQQFAGGAVLLSTLNC